MDPKEMASYLDFADHRPNTTTGEIEDLCRKVLEHGFNSAFVNPHFVPLAKKCLQGKAKVGTVVSFPLGQEFLAIKVASVQAAGAAGADEIDVSLNVSLIREGRWGESLGEMTAIVCAANEKRPMVVKFISEVGYLTPEEIKKVAILMVRAGADFFKTSSGSVSGSRGPTVEDVKLVREAVGDNLKIKVAGGIANYTQAAKFVEAGADRIGTSHAVEIVAGGKREISPRSPHE